MRFVEIDLEILRERWQVREWYQRDRQIDLLGLARAVAESQAVFAWFASWHSFWPLLLARRLKRPAILVVGGYDTARRPDIGYGHERGGLKRWISRATVKRAAVLTTFSKFSQEETASNLGIPADRIRMIYLGVPDDFGDLPKDKENLVLSVGNIDRESLQRKGHSAFIGSADFVKRAHFTLAGTWRDSAINELRNIASDNVSFPGYLSRAELTSLYRRASVYVQASQHEGFGLATAEAMLGGCVPVVSRTGSLPEVVGDAGYYLDSVGPEAIAASVRKALEADVSFRSRARDRIATTFPISLRRQQLHTMIERLL